MKLNIPEEVFEIGILNRQYHDRLLADLERLAAKAGIPPEFVWAKLSKYCTDAEVTWVKEMRRGDTHGMAYVGNKTKVPVEDKMMAITGACLRNYTDARIMSVQDVIHRLHEDNMPQPTVLLIPNFCMDKGDGGHIAQWEISSLLGLLYSRLARNLKTVIYVGSMASLADNYGSAFRTHVEAHYSLI